MGEGVCIKTNKNDNNGGNNNVRSYRKSKHVFTSYTYDIYITTHTHKHGTHTLTQGHRHRAVFNDSLLVILHDQVYATK